MSPYSCKSDKYWRRHVHQLLHLVGWGFYISRNLLLSQLSKWYRNSAKFSIRTDNKWPGPNSQYLDLCARVNSFCGNGGQTVPIVQLQPSIHSTFHFVCKFYNPEAHFYFPRGYACFVLITPFSRLPNIF